MSADDSVQALARGLRILRHLQAHASLGFAELQGLTGLSKGALTRALATLRQEGWVSRRLIDNRYHLDVPAQPQDAAGQLLERLAALAAPEIARLQDRMIWPSDIAICKGGSMLILDSSRALSPLRLDRKVVTASPSMLWSAMGRAYLAHCPVSERSRITQILRASGQPDDEIAADRAWVARVLKATREQGYGVREEGYLSPDNRFPGQLGAIAVPVFAGERVFGSLSCVWLTEATSREQIVARHLAGLRTAAQRIGHRLAEHGFDRPPWMGVASPFKLQSARRAPRA